MLTVGYIAWILRGGALAATLLSTMPLWRQFDPLPLLAARKKRKKKKDEEEKDPFDKLFYRIYRKFLKLCIRMRWVTVGIVVISSSEMSPEFVKPITNSFAPAPVVTTVPPIVILAAALIFGAIGATARRALAPRLAHPGFP